MELNYAGKLFIEKQTTGQDIFNIRTSYFGKEIEEYEK